MVCNDVPTIIPDIVSSLPFLISLAKDLTVSLIFSKEPIFYLDFFGCLFSISLISTFISTIYFLLLTLSFITLSYLVSLSGSFSHWFKLFFFSNIGI